MLPYITQSSTRSPCQFTAPDLSEHARQLDDLEMSYDDDNTGTTSTNMDDTGFFSVQVLDRAVDVWNLTCVVTFVLSNPSANPTVVD